MSKGQKVVVGAIVALYVLNDPAGASKLVEKILHSLNTLLSGLSA